MSNLTRQQQAAYVSSNIAEFTVSHEVKEGKVWVGWELIQVSANPLEFKIVCIGDKLNKDVLSITLTSTMVNVKSLIKEGESKGLPSKYVHTFNGTEILSHTQAARLIALPKFLEGAASAVANNDVCPQWLFVATLLQRLKMDAIDETSKMKVQDFTPNDACWAFNECIQTSKQFNLHPKVTKMFEVQFAKFPEEVRKPFELVDARVEKIKEQKAVTEVKAEVVK